MLPCPSYCKQCCNEHWGIHISFNSGFLSVHVCPAVGLLGCTAVLFPVFQGISTLFSTVTILVCSPTNSVREFPFLHTLSSIYCWAAVTGALSMGERSYPMSEVRGRSQEDPMPKGWRPRRVTPRPSSGAAAESARLRQHRNSREETPCVRGQGRRPTGATPYPRSSGCVGTGGPRGAIPH